MKVNPEKPHRIVYAIQHHPQLGPLLEPYAVQLNDQGKVTLTYQRLYVATAEAFKNRMDETDWKLMELLDPISAHTIAKKFQKSSGKKSITKNSLTDFFTNQLDKKLLQEHIRPMIDQQLQEALPLCRDRMLFEADRNGNPSVFEITFEKSPVSVLFHIKRNDEGTLYYPTLKHEGEPLQFMKKGASIVCDHPCWLLLDRHLYYFSRDFPGSKLRPFLDNFHIKISRKSEPQYYRKFVKALVEEYDVKAEGVIMQRKEAQIETHLRLELDLQMNPLLIAEYHAGDRSFRHGQLIPGWVSLDETGEQYQFTRYWVVPRFEDRMRKVFTSLGLIEEENGVFRIKGKKQSIEDYLTWLGKKQAVLAEHDIITTQSLSEGKQYFTGMPRLEIGYEVEDDWFELYGKVWFGDYEFSLFELRKYILAGKREIPLPNGEMGRLPEEWFSRWEFLFLMTQTEGEQVRLGKSHFALLQEVEALEKQQKRLHLETLNRILQPQSEAIRVDPSVQAELRPYQTLGFNWLYALYEEGFGGCLADDMGLGKTLQTLAFIQTLLKNTKTKQLAARKAQKPALAGAGGETDHPSGALPLGTTHEPRMPPSLVVMPTSLIYNWQAETQRFCPELRVLVYQGAQRTRKLAQFNHFDLVLTTYGTLRNDIEELAEQDFLCVILDESQSIKNPESKVSRAVRRLQARTRMVLTGTPIENSLSDLWSQMAFINPGLLGSLPAFKKQFAQPIEKNGDERRRERLQKLIKPFILRRTKEEVASDLPELSTQIYYCEMSNAQKRAYESLKSHYRNRIMANIEEQGIARSQMFILKGLTELRLMANHPVMVQEDYQGDSGKQEDVWHTLASVIQEGHKVLVFSQFVRHLQQFRLRLNAEGLEYAYLAGNTRYRQRAIDSFNTDPNVQIFLISLKAGGVGLNLVAADYVFLLDPWWNPAVESQAISRAHRIGQDKKVLAYKFISRNTIEEKILRMQERKKALFNDFIEHNQASKLSETDIQDLLS